MNEIKIYEKAPYEQLAQLSNFWDIQSFDGVITKLERKVDPRISVTLRDPHPEKTIELLPIGTEIQYTCRSWKK